MLKLTPLEQTRSGQELMELGKIKGREEGRVEGRAEGHIDGLIDAIRIVLLTRFPDTTQEAMTRLIAIFGYIHDVETVGMLLQLTTQTDSFAAFEQKVLDSVVKSALQNSVNGKSSLKEETQ